MHLETEERRRTRASQPKSHHFGGNKRQEQPNKAAVAQQVATKSTTSVFQVCLGETGCSLWCVYAALNAILNTNESAHWVFT